MRFFISLYRRTSSSFVTRKINILATHQLSSPKHGIAGCILKIKSDRSEQEDLRTYINRSQTELVKHVAGILHKKYFTPKSKFFIGFVQQTIFFHSPGASKVNDVKVFGGHTFTGITDKKLKFLPDTVISKSFIPQTPSSQEEEKKDALITNPYDQSVISLKGQDFELSAAYETVDKVNKRMYAEESKFGAEQCGSSSFIIIIPLLLTKIDINMIIKKIKYEKENSSTYNRLLAACGQAVVKVYTNEDDCLYALTPQLAMIILLEDLISDKELNKSLKDNIFNSGLYLDPFLALTRPQEYDKLKLLSNDDNLNHKKFPGFKPMK